MTTAQQLTRAATTAPTTVDEATRSVDLLIATDAPLNGVALTCSAAAVMTSDAPIPVLLSHANHVDAMAGRLGPLRFEPGRIVARAFFTDAPAADQGWQLARAGCAVSVGATYAEADVQLQGSNEIVRRWRLIECSLVPAGLDPAALTRSIPSIPLAPQTMESSSQAIENSTNVEPQDEQELTRAEANRQLKITRAATASNLSIEDTDRIIKETAGQPASAGVFAVVRAHREAVERRSPVVGGINPQLYGDAVESDGLESTLARALAGERLGQPLWLTLRESGIGHGNDGASVWRSALAGEGRWLARGSMSTSDLPSLLTTSGNRRLMEKFLVADAGIRIAASVRELQDYRAAGVIDAGMIGTAKEVKEGGEVTFSSVNETAATYKPARYALGLSFTPQMLANDDLSALDIAISELAEAMLDTEASKLVDLLEGASLGRNAPDGKALFHADHANVVTPGPLSIEAIGSAVAKLRNQKSLGGRYISTEPAAIIVSPGFETTARQLLSGAIQAATSAAVNPWAELAIAVEPRLSGSFAYVVGTGRKALELGRLTSGPVMTAETDFTTSCYRAKSEHVFGAIVAEHRSIVRLATA